MLLLLSAMMSGPGEGAAAEVSTDAPFWTGHPDSATFTRMMEARLERARLAVEKMTAIEGPRTIENTLQPYDDALTEIDAVGSQASLMENVHPDVSVRAAAEKMSRQASAFSTALSLNREAFDALAALDLSHADAVTKFYVTRELRDFRLAGVDRDEATRAKAKGLREELVEIGQTFARNIRDDDRTITVHGAAELEGLPQDYIDRHPPDASGEIRLTMDYPDARPVLQYANSDDLRHRLYMAFSNRAYPVNMDVLKQMMAKRHELATTLGYSSWAEYVTADKMVGTDAKAADFIEEVANASAARGNSEYEALLARLREDDPEADAVQSWQSGYYTEQVRKSSYDFDSQQVRPYFPYDRVKDGVLGTTSRLFGVEYRQVKDAPVWDPSVECYEMFENGRLVGRFYLDMHPRDGKFNHAAQFDVRTGIEGRQIPEAALVCNFPGGAPGDPGLMQHGDVVTFLHEFGHLIHTLFAGHQKWCGIGGIRTEWDFVEAPSQMLEEWAWDPATLATFARHYRTNEPIPAELVGRMKRASEYGKGLRVRRQMALAQTSLSFYRGDPAGMDTDAMVREISARYQPHPFVDGTHTQCAFGHLGGYSAIYYTYMWSLVIAKDMFSQFDRSDLLKPGVAVRYRNAVLAAAGTKPAAAMIEDFLGRPFNSEAWKAWMNERER